ncbi:MAG: amidohydrolase family protein [Verrucomicrobia bacterium]|nr:amidohydrolase family protein [Verrucomicrobiota bacterium]
MIFDVNAHVGHYPFRSLRARTAAEVVALLDRHGIDRALVSSLHAVFYRDAHRGNEELWAEVQPWPKRLVPVATVNPKYAGWERDFATITGEWKARAVTLVPEHHGYTLDDESGRAALTKIEAAGVPLLLTQRLEDRRQRHAWDRAEDLTVASLFAAAKAFPTLRFILSNWAGLDGAKLADAGLRGRVLIDFARLQVVYREEVPKLIAALGVEALAFGSHLPFDYVAGSLIKLENLDFLSPADRERVAWRNAVRFLGLEEKQ